MNVEINIVIVTEIDVVVNINTLRHEVVQLHRHQARLYFPALLSYGLVIDGKRPYYFVGVHERP